MSDKTEYGLASRKEASYIEAPALEYLPPQLTGKSKKIALIGCGGISNHHLKNYRAAGLEVAAMCDAQVANAERMAREYYPDASIHEDFQSVLDLPDIDVVDLALHPAPRLGIMEAAIRQGKAVLSQKPFVTDLDDGERLATLADSLGVPLAVNHNGRWAPHFSWILSALKEGLIGGIQSVDFSLQWNHRWIEATPFNDLEPLILYDFAIHWFDIAAQMLPGQQARFVTANATRVAGQTARPPMAAQVMIAFPDAQVTMSFNGNVEFSQQDQTVVCGEKGTLRSSGPSLSEQQVSLETADGPAEPRLEGQWFENGFQGTMLELLRAIEENRTPRNDARSSLRGLELCFAAVQSARQDGAPIRPGEIRRCPL